MIEELDIIREGLFFKLNNRKYLIPLITLINDDVFIKHYLLNNEKTDYEKTLKIKRMFCYNSSEISEILTDSPNFINYLKSYELYERINNK